MTAICGGGSSSAQPGFGEFIYVAPAALGAFLNNIPTVWAVGLAGFIGSVTFRLATFCTTDPPAVPTFTAQDVADLLNPYNPFAYNNAQSKFQDLIGAFMWYQVCKCDSVATPAPPAAPAAPTGMPDINPPAVGPSYPTGQTCNSYDFGTRHVTGTFTGPFVTIPIDGITYMTLDIVERSRATDPSDHYFTQAVFLDSSGANLGSTLAVGFNSTADTLHAQGALPAGTATIRMNEGDTTSFGPAMDVHTVANFYCGTTPGGGGGVVPQPCPTDPYVQGLLEQILALVTLTQRQAAPFAYVAGAAHAGLTGQGSFDVQGLLGARVEITNFGFNTGVEDGDPDELWHAGWVNWGNADGVSSRQFLTNAQMLTLPSLAGQYTEFHYSLQPGVEITVTELEREP